MNDVTLLLNAVGQGDVKAAGELLPVIYQELHQAAPLQMAHEQPGHTLQTTALVHEAWLRLVGPEHHTWQNRAHFFSAAAEAMRRVLVDNARRRSAQRHGGGQQRVDLHESEVAAPANDEHVLALHEALDEFAARDPQKAELVKLRFFAGLSFAEAARILGVSEPTAKRWWTFARAWLARAIEAGQTD